MCRHRRPFQRRMPRSRRPSSRSDMNWKVSRSLLTVCSFGRGTSPQTPTSASLVRACPCLPREEGAVCVSSPEMLTTSPLEFCLHVQAGRDGSIAGDALQEPQRGHHGRNSLLGTFWAQHQFVTGEAVAGRRTPGGAVHSGLRRLQCPSLMVTSHFLLRLRG